MTWDGVRLEMWPTSFTITQVNEQIIKIPSLQGRDLGRGWNGVTLEMWPICCFTPFSFELPTTHYQLHSTHYPLATFLPLVAEKHLVLPLLTDWKPARFMLCSVVNRTLVLFTRAPTTKGALIMSAETHARVCGQLKHPFIRFGSFYFGTNTHGQPVPGALG